MKLSTTTCIVSLTFLSSLFFLISAQAADLNINILAVNGTDASKEKEIKYRLPKELSADDIVDTNGLDLDYDVNAAVYSVSGKVNLGPKESKTFKVRIHDVWHVEDKQVKDIKDQIDDSIKRIQGTEYSTVGDARKQGLLQRLDYIVDEQTKYADDIETRMDRYRVYSKELEQIRKDALSVSYWRTKPPEAVDHKLLKYIIDIENPYKNKELKTTNKYYLPAEVKPEHLVDSQGFSIRYDPDKGQSYLSKEEDLKPQEKKRYEVTIMDIWSVAQTDIDNLKERSRKAFKLLENSEYKDSASYLIENIKVSLEKVEESQKVERDIKGHIGAYRVNSKLYESALSDVEALEDLLNALRENLERSKVKNVLQKIKSVRSLADIAESIFGTKPSINNTWKIITAVVIFVGILTLVNFVVWSNRSKDLKLKNLKEAEAKKEEPAKKA
jgi:hypothetical protein